MNRRERATLGRPRARAEKWHVAPALAPARLPLGITYHLVRPARVADVEVVAVRPYDPALLLGNAFLTYLADPDRLRRQLEVGAAVAQDTPLYQVRVGVDADSARVAEVVLHHADAVLAAGG
jgi:hypothetical protein